MISAVIVDDDFDTMVIFTELLELIPVKIVGIGTNGKDAVEQYKKYQPDIIFLDLAMPDYDGYYAIEKIKEISKDAKIIVTTANIKENTTDRIKKLGVNTILYKPFGLEQIEQVLTNELKIQS